MSLPESTRSDPTPPSSTSPEMIGARIDRLPHGRFQRRVLICTVLAFIFEIGDQNAAGLTASAIRDRFDTDLTGIAFAVSAMYLGLLVGAVLAGQGDRFGRRFMIITGMVSMSLFSGVSAMSTGIVMLVLVRFLTGIGLGLIYISIVVYLSEVFPVRRRAFAVGLGIGIAALGSIGLTQLARVVVPWGEHGWRIVFLVGLLGLLAVPVCSKLPESPRWLAARGRGEEADATLRELEREAEERHGPLPEPQLPEKSPGLEDSPKDAATRSLFQGKMLVSLIMLMVVWICYSLAMQVMNTWTPTVLSLRGFSDAEALSTTSQLLVGSLIGSAVAITVGDRLPRRGGIILFTGLAALAMLTFGLSGSHLIIVLAGATVHFTIGAGTPLLNAYAAERFPPHLRSRGSGFSYSVGRFTNVIAPFTIAGVLEALGYKSVAWGGFAAWGLIALTVLVLGARRGRPSAPIE